MSIDELLETFIESQGNKDDRIKKIFLSLSIKEKNLEDGVRLDLND